MSRSCSASMSVDVAERRDHDAVGMKYRHRATVRKFDGAAALRVQPCPFQAPAFTNARSSFAMRASEGRWMYIMCPASK